MSVNSFPDVLSLSKQPEFADRISYDMYASWATSTLLHPGNVQYYRRKVREEGSELIAAESADAVIEEAGDFIWVLTTGRELVKDELALDDGTAEFMGASMQSIADAWNFDALSFDELEDYVQRGTYLYNRKLKVTRWLGDAATAETKQEYIMNVIDDLLPSLLSATCEYAHRRADATMDDILRVNVQKLEHRIATNGLDKALRIVNQ